MENQYAKYYRDKSINQLKAIFENKEVYNNEVRLFVFEELKIKGIKFSEKELIEFENIKQNEAEKIIQQKITKAEAIEGKPILYTPSAIIGFAIFFFTFFGGVLLAINLYQLNKKNKAALALIFAGLATAINFLLASYLNFTRWGSLAVKFIGIFLLIEWFWKKHISYDLKYERKPLWKAIIIAVGALLILGMFILYLNPELAEELMKQQKN